MCFIHKNFANIHTHTHTHTQESKLAPAKNGATLWETEELALRFIVEDGKMNLCLRNLIDCKHYQRQGFMRRMDIPADKMDKIDKFERGIGVVLKNLWGHIEALQTTDLPALVNHIADTLHSSNTIPAILGNS